MQFISFLLMILLEISARAKSLKKSFIEAILLTLRYLMIKING